MGWSGTSRLIWGDEPQDIVDRAVNGISRTFDPYDAPKARRELIAKKLLANRSLRVRVNKVYQQAWGRPANNNEFKNLIKLATNLGGRTLTWQRRKTTTKKRR